MECRDAIAALLQDASETMVCLPAGRPGAFLLNTVWMYSDHDLVQVLVEELPDGNVRISDGGMTVVRLDVNGAPWEGGTRRERMVAIARAYGVDLDEDYVINATSSPAELPGAVQRVASVAVQIDGFIHEEPIERSQTFSGQVSDWLRERTSKSITPNPDLPGTKYTASLRVETFLPVYIQAVAGSNTTERRKGAQVAGWQYEAAAADGQIRPEQAVVLLRDRIRDFPKVDIDRIAQFATVATWEDRMRLNEHLRGADEPGWSSEDRVLTSIQYTM